MLARSTNEFSIPDPIVSGVDRIKTRSFFRLKHLFHFIMPFATKPFSVMIGRGKKLLID